jgi:outer membrane protein OmpA-like peptidoglycan-associated protein
MLTDATGKYSFNGRPNRDYIVKVIAGDDSKTMAFTSKNIFDKIQLDTVIIHDKEPVKEVVPQFADTLLYIVYFDFDKFAIKQEAKSTLEDVVSTLNEDPELKITLWGHADQSGKDAYNDRLSLARTSAVLKYLQAAGIESSRIRLASFGETKPVIDGATKKQARFNRRVEISIRK